MTHTREWTPVSRAKPCPACGRGDWCAWSRAGFLKCERAVEAPRGMRIVRTIANGALFRDAGHEAAFRPTSRLRPIQLEATPNGNGPDFAALAGRYSTMMSGTDRDRLAASLGVTTDSLRRLSVGRIGKASSWPMTAATGRTTGIRLRYPDGSKTSVRGSRDGLFLPSGLTGSGPLLIAEGASDTAALLDLEFDVIGRSSCGTGTRLAIEFLRAKRPGATVIVADAGVPGQRGAASLASTLTLYCPDVRVITPPEPFKDARAWKQDGARRGDLLTAIEAATPLRATVAVRGAAR